MKPSLRKILRDSHIAAVAIAVLLMWSLEWIWYAVHGPFWRIADFVFNLIAILGLPFGSGHFTFTDRLILVSTLSYCFYAITAIAAAWLLSRWAYGMSPSGVFRGYHARIVRKRVV